MPNFPCCNLPLAASLLLVVACSSRPDDTKTANVQVMPGATQMGAGAAMTGMSMTGDPDHDFLRLASDHHHGLIAMAHETMEKPRGTAASRADAAKLDSQQDAELAQLVGMLEKNFHDPYEPMVSPEDKGMLDSLLTKSGAEYARKFYEGVLTHHRMMIATIDDYLPKATNADLKSLAEKMKQEMVSQLGELERKAKAP